MAFEGSLVSVVIPVHNGERFVKTLASALAQTYEPLEVGAFDNHQFGAALRYHAKALKALSRKIT
jgi:hypothetical protein